MPSALNAGRSPPLLCYVRHPLLINNFAYPTTLHNCHNPELPASLISPQVLDLVPRSITPAKLYFLQICSPVARRRIFPPALSVEPRSHLPTVNRAVSGVKSFFARRLPTQRPYSPARNCVPWDDSTCAAPHSGPTTSTLAIHPQDPRATPSTRSSTPKTRPIHLHSHLTPSPDTIILPKNWTSC